MPFRGGLPDRAKPIRNDPIVIKNLTHLKTMYWNADFLGGSGGPRDPPIWARFGIPLFRFLERNRSFREPETIVGPSPRTAPITMVLFIFDFFGPMLFFLARTYNRQTNPPKT